MGSKLTITSLIVGLLCTTVCCIVLVIYVAVVSQRCKEEVPPAEPPKEESAEVACRTDKVQEKSCNTPQCLRDAARIAEGMNRGIDPCENFYEFACGRWPGTDDDHSGQPASVFGEWHGTVKVDQRVLEQARRLMELPVCRVQDTSAERKVKDYYSSCTSLEETEAGQIKGIRRLLRKLGGWNGTDGKTSLNDLGWDPDSWKFEKALKVSTFELFSEPLFRVSVAPTFKSAGGPISQGILIAPRDRCITKVFYNLKAFRRFLHDVGKAINGKNEIHKFVENVIEAYKAFCYSNIEARNVATTVGRLTSMLNLNPETSKGIEWSKFLSHRYRDVKDNTDIGVQILEKEKIEFMLNTAMAMDGRKFRDFLTYIFVEHHIDVMPVYIKRSYYHVKGDTMPPRTYDVRSWKNCLLTYLDRSLKLPLVAELDQQRRHPVVSDKMLKKMTSDIRTALIERTGRLTWMNDEIKAEIKRRMSNKIVMFNAPDWILDHQKMDYFYASLEINSSAPFIENYINGKRFNDIVEAGTLSDAKHLDWLRFLRQPHSIFTSAENLVQSNAFALFPALFREPYYHKSSQEFIKYSGIGMVIGNEFGRDFEGFSLRATNLSKIEGIDDRELCMKKYYNTLVYRGYKAPDVYLLGTADVAGLNWAYEAYKKSSGRANDRVYSTLPYTQDQLFFIHAAQLLCRPRDPSNKDYKADNEIRVLGMVSQTQHVGKVFQCPQGSAMYPIHTCGIL